MSALGAIVTQAIVHHYGRDEFLQRLSHPFWFQSFGAVILALFRHYHQRYWRVETRPRASPK
jgi:Protein of unknown function (DUF763)